MSSSPRRSIHVLLAAAFVLQASLVALPGVDAIHGTEVCDATADVCFRVVVVSYLGDVVPSTSPSPTGTLHVATGLIHVDLQVDYVEFAFAAVSFTGPGQPADWSALDQDVTSQIGTRFIPGTVTSTPVDVTLNPADPGASTGQLWSVRYQVWRGTEKLLDAPGVACTC